MSLLKIMKPMFRVDGFDSIKKNTMSRFASQLTERNFLKRGLSLRYKARSKNKWNAF